MMGTKVRLFGPLEQVCLEDLVPKDSFYRHADRVLDLAFVRDRVRTEDVGSGRPSVARMVFCNRHLRASPNGHRS